MTDLKHKPNYWQNKIAAWMNESPIKVFDIARRNEIAEYIRSVFAGLDFAADEQLIVTADHIASGLTRAALPPDDGKLNEIVLKHPLVKGKSISFDISSSSVDELKECVKKQIEEDLAHLTVDGDPEKKAQRIFNYLFFALNKQLRKNNVGNLGAFWDILPADTRMPDHPMWHHFGLTSAIYSSLERNDSTDQKENLCMVVYSITPVQDFIGKARKLRDYWTGSVLLSYLAFTGITCIVEELGPDHILYPSLHNQALMEEWLRKGDEKLGEYITEQNKILKDLDEESKSIASFPNKFVFICNSRDVEVVCKAIESKIDEAWKATAGIVKEYVAKRTQSSGNGRFDFVWDNAIDKYWKYSWAAINFATINNKGELEKLLPKTKWENEFEAMKKFDECFKKWNTQSGYDVSNLYGTTHSLVQGLLAAGKNKPVFANIRNTQNGEKCPLCGENEVLNNSDTNVKANDYKKNVNDFWNKLRERENSDENFAQVGKNERLCAVCALKRFLPLALKDSKEHILYPTLFKPYQRNNFPSTTEMSAWEFLQKYSEDERKNIADELHNHEFDPEDDSLGTILKDAKDFETKYYAFLLMDGDKMGDLINGETTEASWKDVLNIKNDADSPFKDADFAGKRRTINPALHSMISDSLNNFARYGVQPNVNRSGGRLIYAGGDDVCAILPLSKAFEVADSIRHVYQFSYAQVTDKGSKSLVDGEQKGSDGEKPMPEMDKIVMHLGHTDNQDATKISLSGAIIIAHHKQPLKEVIADAHKVLDGVAKNKSGRNSLAIRLKKRSGGDRDTWFKWEKKNPFTEDGRTCRESFLKVVEAAKKKDLSTSLLYKLEELRGALEPLSDNIEGNKEKIRNLIRYEVEHSGFKNDNPEELSVDLAGICVKRDRKSACDTEWYNPDAAVIANFIAQKKTIEDKQLMGGKNE